MRKLYALLAGFLFTLLAIDSNALPVTPDVANFSFSIQHEAKVVVFTNTSSIGNEPGVRRAYWNFGDGTGSTDLSVVMDFNFSLPSQSQ